MRLFLSSWNTVAQFYTTWSEDTLQAIHKPTKFLQQNSLITQIRNWTWFLASPYPDNLFPPRTILIVSSQEEGG
jgi:hypothetical protein